MHNYASPITQINSYLLDDEELRELLGYDGTGLRPIFPAQEPREAEGTFLTYRYRGTRDYSMWFIEELELTYTIVTERVATANAIQRKISDLLGRLDESAHEINKWAWAEHGGTNWEIHYSRLMTVISPTATPDEGGPRNTMLVFRIRYCPTEIRQTVD